MLKNLQNSFFYLSLVIMLLFFSNSKTYAWDGKKDGTGTHSMIVTQAVEMLENDLSTNEPEKVKKNLEILKENLHKFQLGSTFPDYDSNAYDLYQDHFWDPDTGNNFTIDNKWYAAYPIYETAESQVRKFSGLAKNEWKKGNYEEAVWLLGQGMHYLGDLNTPYHAANVTAVDSAGHTKYETFVENRKEKYKLYSAGCKTNEGFYADTLNEINFNTWSKDFSTYWGKKAKKLYYSHSTMSNTWEDWDYSGNEAIHNSQMSTAGFLYRFLNEVSETVEASSRDKIHQLIISIKTANESKAGTDHYVYFGFETKDGKKYEWALDNPGDDFEVNQVDSYIINIKDGVDIDDISKTWIRKSKYSEIRDDWKPEYIRMVANGSVKLDQTINEWFGNYKTYYLNPLK